MAAFEGGNEKKKTHQPSRRSRLGGKLLGTEESDIFDSRKNTTRLEGFPFETTFNI